MLLIQQIKLRVPHELWEVKRQAARILNLREEELLDFQILRRSLDARKKPEIYAIYSVEVSVRDEERILSKARNHKKWKDVVSKSDRVPYIFPKPGAFMKGEKEGERLPGQANGPVIVGAGPAGLFCAYYLAMAGLCPLLLERGKAVEERQRDVELFWKTGMLNPNSNVQFGEGGAGTFSDGKLNTLVKDKEGRNRAVLETFVRFGAKKEILYDAKPHVGTDELARIVSAMRREIQRLGGEVRFESRVTDLIVEQGSIRGIVIGGKETLACEQVVLAIGHSARDTFSMLLQKKIPMEAKPFAVGFRVQHPQTMINLSQYGAEDPGELGAAPYKVTAKTSGGRGVYSFCMCPGGYVVNSSSEEGRLAVNGMSYSGRNGRNANSAIIVAVTPEDYPGEGPLAGIAFQRALEERAFELGKGRIPVQRYGDYQKPQDECQQEKENPSEASALEPECKGAYAWADLRSLLPVECREAFLEGMAQFGRQIKGFDREDCILAGVESRTSSPVRILRGENLSSEIEGLYPCGEGAGYAGGITSAAMDGLRVAEVICKRLTNSEKRSRIDGYIKGSREQKSE